MGLLIHVSRYCSKRPENINSLFSSVEWVGEKIKDLLQKCLIKNAANQRSIIKFVKSSSSTNTSLIAKFWTEFPVS